MTAISRARSGIPAASPPNAQPPAASKAESPKAQTPASHPSSSHAVSAGVAALTAKHTRPNYDALLKASALPQTASGSAHPQDSLFASPEHFGVPKRAILTNRDMAPIAPAPAGRQAQPNTDKRLDKLARHTEAQLNLLQPEAQEAFRAFYAEAKAYVEKHFPGWTISGNGSERKYSAEVARGKSANVPLMHFSRLAMDFQPVIDGEMVHLAKLKSPEFEKYNKAIGAIADKHGLHPGVHFDHPEHFENRMGLPYSREIQEKAEAGDFGLIPKRDKTQSRIEDN